MITVEYENTRTRLERGVSFVFAAENALLIYDTDNKVIAAFNGNSWKRVDIEQPTLSPQ